VNPERPGELQAGTDVSELVAAVEELRKRVDLLAAAPDRRFRVSVIKSRSEMTAFVVMPFGSEDLQVVYEDYVKPTVEIHCALRCVRGDDMFGSGVIMDHIIAAIAASEIVIADLTGQNANVFYEVGIAHATDRPVLLLAQSVDDVPFDLRHRRVLIYDYSPRGCKRLEQRLKDHILDMRRQRKIAPP
jgi:hypothetical protein